MIRELLPFLTFTTLNLVLGLELILDSLGLHFTCPQVLTNDDACRECGCKISKDSYSVAFSAGTSDAINIFMYGLG